MASIKGISLKSIKRGIGHDLAGFQANIYLNNKRIGHVLDDGYGGYYDIRLEKEEETFKQQAENFRVESNEKILTASEHLIYELLVLTELENDYKKAVKKGYNSIALLDYRPRTETGEYKKDVPVPVIKEETYFCSSEKDIEKLIVEKNPPFYQVFRSLEDFAK